MKIKIELDNGPLDNTKVELDSEKDVDLYNYLLPKLKEIETIVTSYIFNGKIIDK